jgi:UDP-glucose 4-epimerase
MSDQNKNSKLVLVTGGAGFIGSHQCHDLLKQGYKVRVMDNLISGDRALVPPAVEFIESDICDRSAVKKA